MVVALLLRFDHIVSGRNAVELENCPHRSSTRNSKRSLGFKLHADIVNAVLVGIVIDLAADAVHASLQIQVGLGSLAEARKYNS